LAETLNVGGRRVLDGGMRNAGCAPVVGAKGRVADGELFRMRMIWALVERRDPSMSEGTGQLSGMVVSYEMVNARWARMWQPCGLREICDWSMSRFGGRDLGLMWRA
jgi:hypothetical protein